MAGERVEGNLGVKKNEIMEKIDNSSLYETKYINNNLFIPY